MDSLSQMPQGHAEKGRRRTFDRRYFFAIVALAIVIAALELWLIPDSNTSQDVTLSLAPLKPVNRERMLLSVKVSNRTDNDVVIDSKFGLYFSWNITGDAHWQIVAPRKYFNGEPGRYLTLQPGKSKELLINLAEEASFVTYKEAKIYSRHSKSKYGPVPVEEISRLVVSSAEKKITVQLTYAFGKKFRTEIGQEQSEVVKSNVLTLYFQ